MTPEQADHLITAINQLSFVLSAIALTLAFGLAALAIAVSRRRQEPATPPAAPPPASDSSRNGR